MGLTVSSGGGDYESLQPGRYKAACYKIVDAGSRMESFKGGKEKKRTLVFLYWEVTHMQMGEDGDEFWDEIKMSDDRPFSISKKYTASLNENATLHLDLKSWRGKPFTAEQLKAFDIDNLLGKTCELEVIGYQKQDGTDGTAVEGVYKPDGGVKSVETENPQVAFDLDVYAQEFTGESCPESKAMCDVWEDMPDWMKEMIEESIELKAAKEKGGSKPAPAAESGGLADLAKDDEPEDDEDVPF